MYDFSCNCSKKSPCVHEASVLYFFEEFPEILEDLNKKDYDITKISKINVNDDLKVVSPNKLNKFLKKEFKKNPKLKYNFIQYFSEESLIDEKAYEKKLRSFLTGKRYGYYDLSRIGSNIKKFMKNDIMVVIEQGEYHLAYNLLTKIMDIFIDELYWNENHWDDIAYYYMEYAYILFETGKLSDIEKSHMEHHLHKIRYVL